MANAIPRWVMTGDRPGLRLFDRNANVRPAGKEGAAQVVDQLGYVQIDTISVIERAHHHVLGTRQRGYHSSMIYELLVDRTVFEYWAHAAA